MKLMSRIFAIAYVSVIASGACAQISGDFNGDGFDDLAVGVAGKTIAQQYGAGAVHIIYGSSSKLTAAGDQLWHQNSPGIANMAETGDSFGYSIASGDFDGDGFDDLAIGVPFEDIGNIQNAGAVHVLYGTADGLSAERSQFFHQNLPNIMEECEANDFFGDTLAVGDFNGDGRDDLAIGAPNEYIVSGLQVGPAPPQGVVHILYGTAQGLRAVNSQVWSQNSPNILDEAEAGDWFGGAMVAGDFNGDGRDDLAIGASLETINGVEAAGCVNVLYGSGVGLRAAGNQLWHQDSPGIRDVAEAGDWFGRSLAAGDFNNDGFMDLAVGVPREDVNGMLDSGAINVIYGSASGLTSTGNQFWNQNSPNIKNQAEPGDLFGGRLQAADFNNDGFDDLLIGIAGESIGDRLYAGAMAVIYGSAQRLTSAGNIFWHQNTTDIPGVAEPNDSFGYAVGVGDFNGDGFADACIGVPGESVPIPPSQQISKIKLHLYIAHKLPDDLDILLVGPTGANAIVMSDVGGNTAAAGVSITLDDAAAQSLPDAGPLTNGTFKPTNFETPDNFYAPAPTPSGNTALSIFNGTSPIGEWSLYVVDDLFVGTISQSNALNVGSVRWTLEIKGVGVYGQPEISTPNVGKGNPYPSTMNITSIPNAGVAHVFYGGAAGLRRSGNQLWHQNRPGINGACQQWDGFGGGYFD